MLRTDQCPSTPTLLLLCHWCAVIFTACNSVFRCFCPWCGGRVILDADSSSLAIYDVIHISLSAHISLRFVSWVFHVIFSFVHFISLYTLGGCVPLESSYNIICIYSIFWDCKSYINKDKDIIKIKISLYCTSFPISFSHCSVLSRPGSYTTCHCPFNFSLSLQLF